MPADLGAPTTGRDLAATNQITSMNYSPQQWAMINAVGNGQLAKDPTGNFSAGRYQQGADGNLVWVDAAPHGYEGFMNKFVPLATMVLGGFAFGPSLATAYGGGATGAIASGATMGAFNAGLTGQSIGKGALTGAVGGAIGGGLNSWESSTGALDGLGSTGVGMVNGGIGGAAGALMNGKNPLQGAVTGAASAGAGSLASNAVGSATGSSTFGSVAGKIASGLTGTAIASTFGGANSNPIGGLGSGFGSGGFNNITGGGMATGPVSGGSSNVFGSGGSGGLLGDISTLYAGYAGYQNAKNPNYQLQMPGWEQSLYQQGAGKVLGAPATAPTYNGQLVAGQNTDQQNANQDVRDLQGQNAGYQSNVLSNANSNAQGVSGNDIQNFLDPYTQSVIDSTNADMQHTLTQQKMQNGDAAQASGAYGGDRQAVENGVLDSNYMRTMATTDAALRSQGYSQASSNALANAGIKQGGNSQLQSAIDANLGNSITKAGTLASSGAAQQQNSQAQLSAQYAEFLRGQGYNQQQIQNAISMMGSLPRQQAVPGTSPVQGALNGLVGGGYSAGVGNGSAGGTLGSAVGGLVRGIGGLFGGGSSGGYTPGMGASIGGNLTFDPNTGSASYGSSPSAGYGSSNPYASIGQPTYSGTGLGSYLGGGMSGPPGLPYSGSSYSDSPPPVDPGYGLTSYLDPNAGAAPDYSSLFNYGSGW